MRSLDLFAVPVSLTYKGQRQFTTLLGGFFSLLIILSFLVFTAVSLHTHIVSPDFLQGNSVMTYFAYEDNTKTFNISRSDSTVAIQILAIGKGGTSYYDASSDLRVVFYKTTDGVLSDPIAAKKCSDLFDVESSIMQDLKVPWLCPNTT